MASARKLLALGADPQHVGDIVNTRLQEHSGLNAAGLAAVLGLAVTRLAQAERGELNSVTDPTGPTPETYETATRAVHDVDCADGPDCLATPTSWQRYRRTAQVAVDAVWPLAVAEGRRQAAEAIRAYVCKFTTELAEDRDAGRYVSTDWIERLAAFDMAATIAEGSTDRG